MKKLKVLIGCNGRQLAVGIASLVAIIIIFVLTSYFFRDYEPDIERIVETKSLLGMVVFVLVFILSIVFAPISAMPLIPIGTRLWGIAICTALSVTGWTIGAMIAFNIARKFGRPYIAKFISLDKIDEVESYIPDQNIFWTIFFFRAVTPIDGLSYGLGLLTKVETKVFFWATLLGLIPFCFIISYLGSLPTRFLILGLLIACLFFLLGIRRVKKKRR